MAFSVCLSACASKENTSGASSSDSDVLTWTRWNGFDDFLELASRTYPEIEWEYTTYAGANRTGYSWVQMRADDIPDIFISSQIIDEDLAKERLVDLTKYDFINDLSISLLAQVSMTGAFTRCLSTTSCMASISAKAPPILHWRKLPGWSVKPLAVPWGGADAVLIAINGDNSRPELRAGLTGKLYAGPINLEVATTITFGSTRE